MIPLSREEHNIRQQYELVLMKEKELRAIKMESQLYKETTINLEDAIVKFEEEAQ